jgi:hypothetical protein
MATGSSEAGSEALGNLGETLKAAAVLAAGLAGDPLFRRLLQVFQEMPLEDRDVVIGAIERDVQARLLSRATEDVTGQAARPNPNARLYVRVHGHEAQRADLEREEMMRSTVAAIRVVRVVLIPEIYAEWQAATRTALEQSTPEEREMVGKLVSDVLDMVTELSRKPGSTPA